MTPEVAIAMLDRQIAEHGQPVSLRHVEGEAASKAQGFVRQFKPEQLVGALTQADRQVVLSPTTLGSYVPATDDQILVSERTGRVIAAEPVQIGSTVVRYNLTARMT